MTGRVHVTIWCKVASQQGAVINTLSSCSLLLRELPVAEAVLGLWSPQHTHPDHESSQ